VKPHNILISRTGSPSASQQQIVMPSADHYGHMTMGESMKSQHYATQSGVGKGSGMELVILPNKRRMCSTICYNADEEGVASVRQLNNKIASVPF
jgi:hypothetical protein